MKVPPSQGRGGGRPVRSFSPLPAGSGKEGKDGANLTAPVKGGGLFKSPLFKLMTELWGLTSDPQGPEILERLGELPLAERRDALFLQLLLSQRKITLTRNQWRELWTIVRESNSPELNHENIGELLQEGTGAENTLFLQGETFFRIFRDGGRKGTLLVFLDEEDLGKMVFSLEEGGRKWEFLLSRKDGEGRMEVFCDDAELVAAPPAAWGEFRKAMAGYGISVENLLKSFQEDPFFSDNGNREPDHLVDIIL